MDALEVHLRRQIEHSRDFFWHRLRWKAVSSYLPRNRPFQLVDVGAGAGLLGEFMKRDRPQGTYRFVEPIGSLEAYLEGRYAASANARGCDRFGGIEYVALLDVLEHQTDDRGFLRELADKAERGTTLFVTVPALMSLWSQWDVALGHQRRYDKATFARSVDGLPLRIARLDYLFPEMLPLAWTRKLRRRRDTSTPASEASAFPDLPRALNEVLYAVGTLSLALRRWAPAGTSLFAVLIRT